MRKNAGESGSRNDTSALKNRSIILLNDSKTARGLPNNYSSVIFNTFEPAKQLHAGKR